jgi:hypothetical protein
MRKILFVLPLLFSAAPAMAQPVHLRVPPQLTDPETIMDVSIAAQKLSDAVFDIHVGDVKAAAEGHEPTPADRRLTLRDLARKQDPNFDRDVHQGIANVGPTLMRSLAAVNRALPAVKQAIDEAQASIDRISASIPDPTYPRR